MTLGEPKQGPDSKMAGISVTSCEGRGSSEGLVSSSVLILGIVWLMSLIIIIRQPR